MRVRAIFGATAALCVQLPAQTYTSTPFHFPLCGCVSSHADIILGDPNLLRVFQPLLLRKDELGETLMEPSQAFLELGPGTMTNLVSELQQRRSLRIGVILDETQKITEAVAKPTGSAGDPVSLAQSFFKKGWYGWQGAPGTAFVRMDIASSHGETACGRPNILALGVPFRLSPPLWLLPLAGLREFTLEPGDGHRLRFVRPWEQNVVLDFMSHSDSPGYVQEPAARKRLHYICGGVVRSLLEARVQLKLSGSSPEGLDTVETAMRQDMSRSCEKWIKEIDPVAATLAANAVAGLMRGSTIWWDLKPAYDQGLVALDPATRTAFPVSSVAASVLHQALAGHVRRNLTPLSS